MVNAAAFNGVNFKFVKSEVSAVSKPLDPNSTTGKETEYDHGKATANLYFMADVSGLYKTVINTSTYVIVTFSDGEKETVMEGWEKAGGALKGFYASEKADTVGEVDFSFAIPKEGMQVVKLMIAEIQERERQGDRVVPEVIYPLYLTDKTRRVLNILRVFNSIFARHLPPSRTLRWGKAGMGVLSEWTGISGYKNLTGIHCLPLPWSGKILPPPASPKSSKTKI